MLLGTRDKTIFPTFEIKKGEEITYAVSKSLKTDWKTIPLLGH